MRSWSGWPQLVVEREAGEEGGRDMKPIPKKNDLLGLGFEEDEGVGGERVERFSF